MHEFLHSLLHHFVIVLALSIKTDGWLRILGHEVHGETDDGFHAWNKEVRTKPHFDISSHVVHFTAKIKVEPTLITNSKTLVNGFCFGESTSHKTQAQGLGFDVVTVQ